MASLPIVNVFDTPYEYEVKAKNYAAFKGMNAQLMVPERLIDQISNHVEAASHMARVGVDNGLENFIDSFLAKSSDFKSFRAAMPSETPKPLSDYQKRYPKYNMDDVNREINNIGLFLTEGQCLFHGGLWVDKRTQEIVLDRPLSTSFCPQVALRNAEFKGKAYANNQIDLFVLRVVNPETKVFCFRVKGTTHGHEKEVLFASGAKLTLRNSSLIRKNYPVSEAFSKNKEIPIYVIEVDVS